MSCPGCSSLNTLLIRTGARCEDCGHEWHRFRATRREPEAMRAAAAALQEAGESADPATVLAMVPQVEDDTEALANGDSVTVKTLRDPLFEVGEKVEVLDAGWRRVCWAEVIEVLPDDRYVLRGVGDGDVDA